ncbi:MAG: formate dehydrogenase subunit delta [Gemmatimonadales bacterium]|nr:formate dehydrogenase subunit delta [Gemmatimonadales bacterium]
MKGIEELIRMANQIGEFHRSFPDRAEGLSGTATHIRRFWDPRMRRALLEHVDRTGGGGLDEIVLEALRVHRRELLPREEGAI